MTECPSSAGQSAWKWCPKVRTFSASANDRPLSPPACSRRCACGAPHQPHDPSQLRLCRSVELRLQGAIGGHERLAEGRQAGATARLTADRRIQHGRRQAAIQAVDQQPGALVGHTEGARRRADRATFADLAQKIDLAGAEGQLAAQIKPRAYERSMGWIARFVHSPHLRKTVMTTGPPPAQGRSGPRPSALPDRRRPPRGHHAACSARHSSGSRPPELSARSGNRAPVRPGGTPLGGSRPVSMMFCSRSALAACGRRRGDESVARVDSPISVWA